MSGQIALERLTPGLDLDLLVQLGMPTEMPFVAVTILLRQSIIRARAAQVFHIICQVGKRQQGKLMEEENWGTNYIQFLHN